MNRDFVIKVPGRFTNAYCKPMRKGISELEYEDPRLDFDNYEPISKETENRVIETYEKSPRISMCSASRISSDSA